MNKFLLLAVISCTVTMFSCEPKGKEIQGGIDVAELPEELDIPLTPLRRIVCMEMCTERVLRVGQSCLPGEDSTVRVYLLEIAQDRNSCKLEVENLRTGRKSSKWVRAEEYAKFKEFGTRGFQVIRLEADQVVLGFYSGEIIECDE